MRTPLIKIYGERHTGTNYLHRLMVRNFNVRLLPGSVPLLIWSLFPNREYIRDGYMRLASPFTLGWKHALVDQKRLARNPLCRLGNVRFLTLTKNPYAWLLSLYRRPFHTFQRSHTFKTFLETPWQPLGREQVPGLFPSPIAMWNEKNAALLRLSEAGPTINLTYEALVADPQGTCERLKDTFELTQTAAFFSNIEVSTTEQGSEKNYTYYKRYYEQAHWQADLDDDALWMINEQLDPAVMQRFSYSFFPRAQ